MLTVVRGSEDSDRSTVLLVDDDPAILELSTFFLRKAGFAVKVAANGRDAQAVFREDPKSIRVLVSDVEMPFVSGPELADFGAACGSNCQVLLMSGKLPPPIAAQRGWEFLAKPFAPSVLVETVQRLDSRVRERPRALVAEDETDMRNRLCELLCSEYEVVAALDGGASVFEKSEELHPDVIVLDLSMPDTGGLAVMRMLQGSQLRIPVVFVTQHTEPAYVDAAFDSGASGYVTKGRMLTELGPALRTVRAGGTYLSMDLRTR